MAKANRLALSVLVVLSFAAFTAAQAYTVTDLGPADQGVNAGAHSINNLGDVVFNNGPSYLRTPTHKSLSLQPLAGGTTTSALGINNYGQIVGESDGPGNYHAVLWKEGKAQDLGTLPGGLGSLANGINASGEVVGEADTARIGREAMVWTQAMGMQGLGVLPGDTLSAAYAINRFGQVVGWSYGDGGVFPFLWSKTTGMIASPVPPGDGGYAFAINDSGQVAGVFITYVAWGHAALWGKTKGSVLDLGVLPGTEYSAAYGINNLGQVVGASGFPNNDNRAFVWSSTSGMQDLNNMIPASSGWLLRIGYAINASGQIVGFGELNGQPEAFLLTPQ